MKKEALRNVFGKYLVELGKQYKDLVVVSCDLKSATKTVDFFKKYPERAIEVGIAEANGLGISAGLALSGYKTLISSFGAFIAGKQLEIRTSISYNNAPVKIIGTHGGFIGTDGATQAGTQDISIMTGMPNFEVFQPCSPIETKKILKYIVSSKKPSYVRICRNEVDEIYNNNYKFTPGNASEVIKGNTNFIISSGPMVHNCIEAVKILETKYKKKVGLINIHSFKPFNHKSLKKIIKNANNILVVEDHSYYGGLFSIINQSLNNLKIKSNLGYIAIDDEFVDSGKPIELEKKFGFNPNNIAKKFSEI
jgi:transketolase